ncbi:MAG: CDP-glycerol glycerophosphotransferase family protein, partial [Propionibacteriaceae bacterium]|nr:CDP-glycerol glycerophosphotransferase family protein [Propionibacteriaceae bacterium]
PLEDKVLFTTWDSDVVTPDFAVLVKRLRALPRPPRIVCLARELRPGVLGYVRYAFHLVRQLYHLATAKVVVLDSYSVLVSALRHRPGLRVVQLWHALGAFKRFGWSVVDAPEGWSAQSRVPARTLSGLLRMHAGYTDAVVSCQGAIPFFAEAYGCDPGILHVGWLPRVDLLRDERVIAAWREQIWRAHPELAGRKVALYAPTLRLAGRASTTPATVRASTAGPLSPVDKVRSAVAHHRGQRDHPRETPDPRVSALVDAVAATDWCLVVKPHPVRGRATAPVFVNQSVQVPDFSALQLLAVADAVITDYSAITYEAYLRGTPVYFYAPDEAEYADARGFYTAPADFPARTYADPADLARDLVAETYDPAAIQTFIEAAVEDSPDRVDPLDLIWPGHEAPKLNPTHPLPRMS